MQAFNDHPTPEPLPWPEAQPHGRRRHVGEWTLTDEQVESFDALLHGLCPQAPRVQADQVAQLSRWLLSLPPAEAQAVLSERLARIDDMRALLDDPDWERDSPGACRLRGLLAYVDQDGIIPNHVPVLGRLDDVLLLELAWPGIASEIEDYLDFRDYRNRANPEGDGAARRDAWVRERLVELAHLQQHAGVRYAPEEAPRSGFHIH